MSNVLKIFRGDLRHLFTNTVAAIVAIGLIIVPPMYAWLTTLGFWNPYGNTGGLEVAVANDDTGYSSALFPTRVDVGNTIMAKLHENDQFHWVFCDSDEVEEGVRSGRFYAGIVIPEGFSTGLMSVMTTSEKTPELIYYVNQKENAIAAHVTATGTSVLQTQIDQSFARTVAEVTGKIDTARGEIQGVNTALSENVAAQISSLTQTLSELNDSANSLSSATASAADAASSATAGLATHLSDVQASLTQTTQILSTAKEGLDASADQLQQALASGNINEARQILGTDPDSLASFIATPTDLVRHAVYEVPTNGDSMSPFYSSLSLWVGAIFLIALTNVNVSQRQKTQLAKPRAWELYLGRYGIFMVMALMQALVLFIGNVFFLQIQCEHPFAYLGTLLLLAIVFSNLVYTLNISFGNIGKAIAIILLVMQLAGTGGIMPIQTSAPIFQAIYPWLPFTHAISALSSYMSGIYGTQLVMDLAALAAFLIPSLLLGLALRNPMIRVNAFIQERLNATKFV